jgi:hypothetical protein|tara:strand:+ start:882 stop:1133 length:252 start_codon:yes stop_codon:yes gene_type:complete
MSTKKVNDLGEKPLPKWYDGAKYTSWETVENRFTGEEILLSPNEVAMYDLIMGSEITGHHDLTRKGLNWFRSANPRAYMVLLD